MPTVTAVVVGRRARSRPRCRGGSVGVAPGRGRSSRRRGAATGHPDPPVPVVLVGGAGQGDDQSGGVELGAGVGAGGRRDQAVEADRTPPLLQVREPRRRSRGRHGHRPAAVGVDAECRGLGPIALRVEALVAALVVDGCHLGAVLRRVGSRALGPVAVARRPFAVRSGRDESDGDQSEHRDRGDRRDEHTHPEPSRRPRHHHGHDDRRGLEGCAHAVDQPDLLDHPRVRPERQAHRSRPDPHGQRGGVERGGGHRDAAGPTAQQEDDRQRDLEPTDHGEADRVDPGPATRVRRDHDQVDDARATGEPREQDSQVGGPVAPGLRGRGRARRTAVGAVATRWVHGSHPPADARATRPS